MTTPLNVFISGTQVDLQPERDAVEVTIRELGLSPCRAETTMGSQSRPTREAVLQALDDCDLYVGVYGGRYGWELPGEHISATEFEYNRARQLGKPILIYVKDVPERETRQAEFIRLVEDFDVGYFRRPPFRESEALRMWLKDDLNQLISELARDPESVRRNQLARAYAGEVHQKFDFWRERYVPLPATSVIGSPLEPHQLDGAGPIPSYFLPAGFVVKRATASASGDSHDHGRDLRDTGVLHDRTEDPGGVDQVDGSTDVDSAGIQGSDAAESPGRQTDGTTPADTHNTEEHFQDIREAIAKTGSAVILGAPGAGKTTALWRLMLDLSYKASETAGEPIPVLVQLGSYDGSADILDHIRRQLAEAVIEISRAGRTESRPLYQHRALARRLDRELDLGRVVVLFDGLNETPPASRTATIGRLIHFCEVFPDNQYVFTCRESDYLVKLPLPAIHIEPLDDDGIRHFISSYAPTTADALITELRIGHPGLWDIARNPYMLAMIVDVHEEHHGLPSNEAALFGEFIVRLLLRERVRDPHLWNVWQVDHANSGPRIDWCLPEVNDWLVHPDRYGLVTLAENEIGDLVHQAQAVLAALSTLAYAMIADAGVGTTVPYELALARTGTAEEASPGTSRSASARRLQIARGASLVELRPDGLRFTHQLIQEYLAALHIASSPIRDTMVRECLRWHAWDRTILFLAGVTEQPTTLVDALVPIAPLLAAWCAGERSTALVAVVEEKLLARLEAIACDDYSPWSSEAIDALASSRMDGSTEILRRVSAIGNSRSSYRAHLALARNGPTATVRNLMSGTDDQPREIRQAAALTLARRGFADGKAILMAWLQDDYVHALDASRVCEAVQPFWTEDDIPALVSLLRSRSEQVRRSAVAALQRMDPALVAPQWLTLLDMWMSKEVEEAALQVLSHLRHSDVVPAIMERIHKSAHHSWYGNTPSREWRFLARIDGGQFLRDLLGSEDPLMVLDTIFALAYLLSHDSIPTLLPLLSHSNWLVRDGVRTAFDRLWNHGDIELILDMVESPTFRPHRTWMLSSLQRLFENSDIPMLLNLIDHSTSDIALAASAALGRVATHDDIPMLLNLIGHSNSDIELAASAALGRVATHDDIPLLLDFVRRESSGAFHALQVLGHLWYVDDIPLLIELVAANEWRVSSMAAEVLGYTDSSAAIPVLRNAVADRFSSARQAAAVALGRLGAIEAEADLIACLDDGWPGVRAAAARALGQLGCTDAIGRLRALLRAETRWLARPGILHLPRPSWQRWQERRLRSYTLRESAVALGRLGQRDVVPQLLTLMGHSYGGNDVEIAEVVCRLMTPEDCVTLLEMLQRHEASVFTLAVGRLIELGCQDVLPAVLSSPYVRSEAAAPVVCEAVRAFGDRALLDTLLARRRSGRWWPYDDLPDEAYWYLCERFGAAEDLISLLGDDDPCVRCFGLRWAARSSYLREATPKIIEMLADEDEGVRMEAVAVLGSSGAREAIPTFLMMLRSRLLDSRVEEATRHALSGLWRHGDMNLLVSLWHDSDGAYTLEAKDTIERLCDARDDSRIIDLLVDGPEYWLWDICRKRGIPIPLPKLVQMAPFRDLSSDSFHEFFRQVADREDTSVLVTLLLDGITIGDGALLASEPQGVRSSLSALRWHPDGMVRFLALRRWEWMGRILQVPREPPDPRPNLAERHALKEVVNVTSSALTRIPLWPSAIYLLAQAIRRLGCSDLALEVLNRLSDRTLSDRDTLRLAAERIRCLLCLGKTDEAQSIGSSLVRTRRSMDGMTDTWRFHREVIATDERVEVDRLLVALGNSEYAVGLWPPYGIVEQRGTIVFIEEARQTLAKGDLSTAHRALEVAGRRDPMNVTCRLGMAIAEIGLNKPESAMDGLAAALARTDLHETIRMAVADLDIVSQQVDSWWTAEMYASLARRKAYLDELAASDHMLLSAVCG